MLTVRAVTKSFSTPQGPLPVLRGIDLDLGQGETLALTGESGSGKSTLLHLIAGLDHPDSGQIMLEETQISLLSDSARAAIRRTRLGLIFQQFNLIPSLTISNNLSFQARLGGRYDADWAEHVTGALGLADLTARYPEHLSGGQQQRVAIGRTLIARPALVLADEPTGNLDEHTADRVMDLMLELVRDAGVSLLMVTHSQVMAARLMRSIHLKAGLIT